MLLNCDYVDYALKTTYSMLNICVLYPVDPSDVDELIDATNGASIAGLT